MAKDTKDRDSTEKALIRELAELLNETGLSEIEIAREGLKVRVARQTMASAVVQARPRPRPPRRSRRRGIGRAGQDRARPRQPSRAA